MNSKQFPRIPLALGLALLSAPMTMEGAPSLIPQPLELKATEAAAAFSPKEITFALQGTGFPKTFAKLVAETAATDWGIKDPREAKDTPANLVFAMQPKAKDDRTGAYTLAIDAKGVRAEASDPEGIINALQTLRAIARKTDAGTTFEACAIKDEPRFAWRGLMLDSSRHVQSPAKIKWLLDQMALLKLNKFHWHLTDSNGWRVQIPAYPKLTQVGALLCKTPESERNGYYTIAQLRDIAAYANTRGIEIIPEIDVPGHSSALAEAYPEFTCPHMQETPRVSTLESNKNKAQIVCAGNEKFMPFIETVIVTTCSALNARRVHLGGDEVETGVWSKCPKCSAAMKALKTDDERKLQDHFLSQVGKVARKHGIETIHWLEHPERGELPALDISQAWRSRQPHEEISVLKGRRTINSRGDFAYLDYPDHPGTCKSGWMPVLPLERVYNFPIVSPKVAAAKPGLMLGGEATLWTEEVLERDISAMLFPRILAFSEQMWSHDSRRNFDDFNARLKTVQPWLESRGIAFSRPVTPDTIPTAIEGAKVAVAKPHNRNNHAGYAIDGNDVTAYVSKDYAMKGDIFAVEFPTAVAAGTPVTVITGGFYVFDEPKGRLRTAVLEAAADGKTWTKVADIKDGMLTAKLPAGKGWTSLRIRMVGDQPSRMVINEIIVGRPKR